MCMGNVAPLNTSFMVAAMVGFLVSVLYIPRFSLNWAFAFGLVFTCMFVASLISMVSGPETEQLRSKRRK